MSQITDTIIAALLSLSTGLLVYIVSEVIKFHAKFIRMEMHIKGLRRDVVRIHRIISPRMSTDNTAVIPRFESDSEGSAQW